MSDHQRLDDLRDYEEAERIGARVRLMAERAQAARVAAHPVRRLLYRLTANLPCRLISRDGAPYLERYLLARIGPLTVYLHAVDAAVAP